VPWFDFFKRIAGSKAPLHDRELIEKFSRDFGYRFKNSGLLVEALTHRSFIRTENPEGLSNERLEYLGDSVLGLLIAEFLFLGHPDYAEGELTKTKAMLVNETTLSMVGQDSGLNRYIFLSQDEENSGGRERNSIVSDAMESIIGAIFLDGGIGAARKFIHQTIIPHIDEVLNDTRHRNYKGELLELMQAKGKGTPHYEVLSENGPDHAKEFKVGVITDGDMTGVGIGQSKKEAEQKAAAISLSHLLRHEDSESEGLKED